MEEKDFRKKVFHLLSKTQKDRERFVYASVPVFSSFDRSRRDFLVKIAMISATIGAFSFLLFDSNILKSPHYLIAGDILLIVVIPISLIAYLTDLRNTFNRYYEMYFSLFERKSEDIDAMSKYLRSEISQGDYINFAEDQIAKTPKYERPQKLTFYFEFMILSVLSFALLFIALSFF